MRRLQIQKCIFMTSKKGRPFHYWRHVKNLTKSGLFQVVELEKIENNTYHHTTFFWNKKVVEDFGQIIDIIDGEEKSKKRNWRLERLLRV